MLKGLQHKSEYYYVKDTPRMVPIAPATNRNYESMDLQTEAPKYNYKSTGFSGAQTASIARRNARERNRVKQVNDGFNALRKRLPAAVIATLSGGARRGSGKKLSKVDTLRMVVEYIKYLQRLVEESDAALGITPSLDKSHYEADEGIFGGSSPYSESVPSPVSSECSSGVSTSYCQNSYIPNSQQYETQTSSMEDDDLLEAISWWQNK